MSPGSTHQHPKKTDNSNHGGKGGGKGMKGRRWEGIENQKGPKTQLTIPPFADP